MSLLDRAIVRAYSQRANVPAVPGGGPSVENALVGVARGEIARGEITAVGTGPVGIALAEGSFDPMVSELAAFPSNSVERETREPEEKPVATKKSVGRKSLTWSWPRIVQQLLNQAEYGFVHLSQQLIGASRTHHKKVIAFISPGQGDGCTSVMLTIGQILSRRKECRTLILEANAGHPTQLELLQVRGECVDELRNEGARRIQSSSKPWKLSGESLALLPLVVREEIPPGENDRGEWEESLRGRMAEWRKEYDLILMDLGPVAQNSNVKQLWWSDLADRVITIASSSRLTANPQGFTDDHAWEEAGIEPLGVIETFA